MRDVYERAIAQIPPSQEKRHWRRYIYLWIFYAVWEEMEAKDMERARQIYQQWSEELGGMDHETIDATAGNSGDALKAIARRMNEIEIVK